MGRPSRKAELLLVARPGQSGRCGNHQGLWPLGADTDPLPRKRHLWVGGDGDLRQGLSRLGLSHLSALQGQRDESLQMEMHQPVLQLVTAPALPTERAGGTVAPTTSPCLLPVQPHRLGPLPPPQGPGTPCRQGRSTRSLEPAVVAASATPIPAAGPGCARHTPAPGSPGSPQALGLQEGASSLRGQLPQPCPCPLYLEISSRQELVSAGFSLFTMQARADTTPAVSSLRTRRFTKSGLSCPGQGHRSSQSQHPTCHHLLLPSPEAITPKASKFYLQTPRPCCGGQALSHPPAVLWGQGSPQLLRSFPPSPWGAALECAAWRTWPAPASGGLAPRGRSCWCSSPAWRQLHRARSCPPTAGEMGHSSHP